MPRRLVWVCCTALYCIHLQIELQLPVARFSCFLLSISIELWRYSSRVPAYELVAIPVPSRSGRSSFRPPVISSHAHYRVVFYRLHIGFKGFSQFFFWNLQYEISVCKINSGPKGKNSPHLYLCCALCIKIESTRFLPLSSIFILPFSGHNANCPTEEVRPCPPILHRALSHTLYCTFQWAYCWPGMALDPTPSTEGRVFWLPSRFSLTLTLKPTCTRPHLTLVLALGSTLHAPAQFLPFPPVRK